MERFLVDVISYNDEKDKFDKSEFECKTNVELEVFEKVYGECSDVVYVILVKVGEV